MKILKNMAVGSVLKIIFWICRAYVEWYTRENEINPDDYDVLAAILRSVK